MSCLVACSLERVHGYKNLQFLAHVIRPLICSLLYIANIFIYGNATNNIKESTNKLLLSTPGVHRNKINI